MKKEFLKSIAKVNTLENSFLRNMVWLIYCNQITTIDGLEYKLSQNSTIDYLIQWAKELDINLIPKIKENLPLGKYAEELIKFYLCNNLHYKLYFSNLQLIEEKTTVGELDFLFEEIFTGESIHLEFSIKYYLQTKINNEIIFLGPNTKDWMDRKISKLVTKQTQLSKTHQHLFPVEIRDISFKPKAILKGCKFYNWEAWEYRKTKNQLNQGWWIDINKIKQLNRQDEVFNVLIRKRDWIFPFLTKFKKLAFRQLPTLVETQLKLTNEVMVVRYTKDGRPIDRGFIMRDNWPNLSRVNQEVVRRI